MANDWSRRTCRCAADEAKLFEVDYKRTAEARS